MTEHINIAIDNYLNRKGLLNFIISLMYRSHSKYRIKLHSEKQGEILLFINNEYRIRKDHFEQLKYIQQHLFSLGIDSTMISAKRVFRPFRFWDYQKQFEHIFKLVKQTNHFKKVVVFCDSVPLQTYIVDQFNKLGVETFSLQHGFYAEDSNKVFRNVYRSSNSKNFFVWDERTLKFMTKHNPTRNYVKVGPHFYKNHVDRNKSFSDRIAIYGCGKDQSSENTYLCKIYNLLHFTGYKPIFIAHPKFNVIDRLNFYFKSKIWISKNKFKNKSYKFSFVLNSSVFLELQSNNENYFLLNTNYSINEIPDLHRIIESNQIHDPINQTLKPFLNPKDSLELITKHLTNGL